MKLIHLVSQVFAWTFLNFLARCVVFRRLFQTAFFKETFSLSFWHFFQEWDTSEHVAFVIPSHSMDYSWHMRRTHDAISYGLFVYKIRFCLHFFSAVCLHLQVVILLGPRLENLSKDLDMPMMFTRKVTIHCLKLWFWRKLDLLCRNLHSRSNMIPTWMCWRNLCW